MRKLALALFVIFVAAYAGAEDRGKSSDEEILDPSGNRYFPETSQLRSTDVIGFAKHLAALKEPSLVPLKENAETDVFRFTWIPTNKKTVSFRAYEILNDGFYIDVKRLSGAGGYFLGDIELTAHVRIDQREFRSMRELAQNDSVRQPFKNLSKEASEYLSSTGDAWIVEVITGGNYYVAHVGDPQFLQTVTPENAKKAGIRAIGQPIEVPDLNSFIRFCEHFLVFTDMNLPKRSVSDKDWIFDSGESAESQRDQ